MRSEHERQREAALLESLPEVVAFESYISFHQDPERGILVTKRYRQEVPCVQWLNRQLAEFYDPAEGQPVAQHEHAALELLAPYGFVPRVLSRDTDSIQMEFAGIPVTHASIPTAEYREQCQLILDTFERLGFLHNDLLPRNVLIDDGRVKIVDFTLAEFPGVELMSHLPDSRWARPGEDRKLLGYRPGHLPKRSRWRRRLSRLLGKRRRR